jgi:hypothetical protein
MSVIVSGAIHSITPEAKPKTSLAASSFPYVFATEHHAELMVNRVKDIMYTGRRPYLTISGIQNKLPTPCSRVAAVMKYAVRETCLSKSCPGGPKKVVVISNMATAGPPVKDVQRNVDRQTRKTR